MRVLQESGGRGVERRRGRTPPEISDTLLEVDVPPDAANSKTVLVNSGIKADITCKLTDWRPGKRRSSEASSICWKDFRNRTSAKGGSRWQGYLGVGWSGFDAAAAMFKDRERVLGVGVDNATFGQR